MTEKDKMIAGKLYIASDSVLTRERQKARSLTQLFNQSNEDDVQRIAYLKELFGRTGENIWIEPSFRCDYGYNTSVGENFYANYDCIIIDVCPVTIGNNTFFGPRVCIYTAAHPVDAEVRAAGLEYGKPVSVGNDVWIGGNAVINPGVGIGNNVVIGSGSVVTKDIPDGVIAVGNPCKVLRPITDEDWKYWHEKQEIWKG